jgi:sugar phosphate isomerase/epimerase
LPSERLGIQLYNVADRIASLGFGPVFEALARIGYKHVEFAGYLQGARAVNPRHIRTLLGANGLTGLGNHALAFSQPPVSDATFERMLSDAETLGLPAIGVSFVNPTAMTVAGWQHEARRFNHYGALAAKRGMGFYVHNHFLEWAALQDDPTRRGEDVLLAETDPQHVSFEMDIYWAFVGSSQSQNTRPFDPLRDYLLPHRSRYRRFHVKDGKVGVGGNADIIKDITDLGEGGIDFVRLFTELFRQAKNEKQRHWYIHERDNASSHPRGSLASSHVSYLYMRYGIANRLSCGGLA